MTKTNAIRTLDQKKIEYEIVVLKNAEGLSGVEVAKETNEETDEVFKTLVTVGASKNHYVFVIPVAKQLDLKKAAKFVGEKNIAMIPQKELLGLTGYVHGGCSPIGMKKYFRTVFDDSAKKHEKIYFSAGKVGLQIKINSADIEKAVKAEFCDLVC